MFKGQPKGLFALALANTGERFGYYTMVAIFTMFLQAKFGFSAALTGQIYAIFIAIAYFMPVAGGMLADRIGYGKCVVYGTAVMFLGYTALAIPTPANAVGIISMIGALLLISVGTGLFKGNLQVLTGNLYDTPEYSSRRDAGFSLFYVFINIGSMAAPSAATAITNWFLGKAGLIYKADIPALAHQFVDGTITPENVEKLQGLAAIMPDSAVKAMDMGTFSQYYIEHLSSSYNMGFAVACVSLVFSIAIYFGFRPWFKHADYNSKQAPADAAPVKELTPQQTKDRMVALFLVFAVVIFFWMAFNQNASSLTWFARDYTAASTTGWTRIGFSFPAIMLIAASAYTFFASFQSEKKSSRMICGGVTAALWIGAYIIYRGLPETFEYQPQIFQQFNPFFVVALTPVSLAIFGALAKKDKEPSAPKKIGLGMAVAAIGYLVMVLASHGQMSPAELAGNVSPDPVVPHYLIANYLVLTLAELLLSPMGISFVSKVAPPQYKGLMMGCWFAATAIGNYLSSIPALLWEKVPLWANWTILAALCLVAAIIMFALLKKIEAATEE